MTLGVAPVVVDLAAPSYVQHLVTDLNDAFNRIVAALQVTGWRKVLRQEASTSSTIDFTIDGAYDCYLIEVVGLVPDTDNTSLYLRVSTDSGVSWKSGGTDYSYHYLSSTDVPANAAVGAATAAQAQLASAIGNTGSRVANGSIHLFQPFTAALNVHQHKMTYTDNTGAVISANGGFRYNTASVINGIRFLMSSGNITSGAFTLYGLPK